MDQWANLLGCFSLSLNKYVYSAYYCQVLFHNTQFSSVAQLCPNLFDPVHCIMPGFPVRHQLLEPGAWSLFKLMSIKSVMPSTHLILSSPFSSCLLSFPASWSPNEYVLCIRWPKYWSFSFSISPSNECSGLISFRMDWLDFLAVQRTLRSLLQHHNSKTSILRCSAFSMIQLSHPHKTTGKP